MLSALVFRGFTKLGALLVLSLFSLLAIAQTQTALQLDKSLYTSGESAYLVGSGFTPNDVLELDVQSYSGNTGTWATMLTIPGSVDGSGGFNTSFPTSDSMVGRTLRIYAHSRASSLTATVSFSVQAAPQARVWFDRPTYYMGEVMVLWGSGFGVNEIVRYEFRYYRDNVNYDLYYYGPVQTAVDGSFARTVPALFDMMGKTFSVWAIGETSGRTAITNVTILRPPAFIELDRTYYRAGDTINMYGGFFQSNEPITLSVALYDPATGAWNPDTEWAAGLADFYGDFTAMTVVPEGWIGKQIRVTAIGISSGRAAQAFARVARIDTTVSITTHDRFTRDPGVVPPIPVTVRFTNDLTAGAHEETDVVNTQISRVAKNGTQFTITSPTSVSDVGGNWVFQGTYYTERLSGLPDLVVDVARGITDLVIPQNNEQDLNLLLKYVFVATPVNVPPTVTVATDPVIDAGTMVGCWNGSGFERAFSVHYRYVAADAKSGSVYADVTDLHTGAILGSPLVATVVDSDAGDSVSVMLPPDSFVTLNGFGVVTTGTSGTIGASDSTNASSSAQCSIDISSVISLNVTAKQPMSLDTATVLAGQGQRPVQMFLTDCQGINVTDAMLLSAGVVAPQAALRVVTFTAPNTDPVEGDIVADSFMTFVWNPSLQGWKVVLNVASLSGGVTYEILADLQYGIEPVPFALISKKDQTPPGGRN